MEIPNNLGRVNKPTRVLSDGVTGTDVLRDYRHAARIFVDGAYRLSPKYGFLFYVEFDFNPLISNMTGPTQYATPNGQNKIANNAAQELGMIVKSVTLPKFTLEVKEHNAYNRKNFVQNRIKYDPVTINFHDDQADTVRNFWYDYYSYYYRDPDYDDVTYTAPHKYQVRPQQGWGYTPRRNSGYTGTDSNQDYQYIQAIRIYSLYQHNFSECELVNPIITSFRHGEHANGENTNLLGHEMSVQFETVKYLTGFVTPNTAGGFVDLHYDTAPSTLPFQGSTFQPSNGLDVVTDLRDTAGTGNQTPSAFAPPGTSNPADASAILASTNTASGYAAGAAVSYQVAGQNSGVNIGGFTLPGFTGISIAGTTAATTNSGFGVGFPATQYAQAGAQFQATGLSGLANGLQAQTVGQIQNAVLSGLGPSPVNLAAVLKNPSKALQTVENMAIGYATSYVNNQVGQLVNSGLSSAKTSIANALGVSSGDLSIKGAVSAIQNQYNLATGTYALPNDFGQQQLASSGDLTGTVADNVQYPGSYMPDLAQLQDTQLAAFDQWSGAADVGALGGSFTSDIGSEFDF
jgi:hypothetical protein